MDDGKDLLSFIAVVVIFIFLLTRIHMAPILDQPDKPFVVKKIKESIMIDDCDRYYGKVQNDGLFSPKHIILKSGTYNIGDTILFTRK